MSKKCPACGSPRVRRSRFRGHEEHERHFFRSPYRCLACGDRFFVISHTARQATIGLCVGVATAFVTFGWLLIPAVTKSPNSTESPNLPNSPVSSEAKAATVAEIAKESRCTGQPVNVTGETYKCATPSGLTAYFVVPAAPPIPSQGAQTDIEARK